MLSVEELTEKILYWLSSDQRVRALAEKLLHRFEETVGDLPASEKHHHSEPGGLYRHSLEVALKALEEFEGDIIMEPRSDGSIDSFRSSRNRPRWQYATFIGALCHDLGKSFDREIRGKGEMVTNSRAALRLRTSDQDARNKPIPQSIHLSTTGDVSCHPLSCSHHILRSKSNKTHKAQP